MPALSAAGLPPLAWRITRTPGSPSASTMSAVPSVRAVVDDDHLDRVRRWPPASAPSPRCSPSRCRPGTITDDRLGDRRAPREVAPVPPALVPDGDDDHQHQPEQRPAPPTTSSAHVQRVRRRRRPRRPRPSRPSRPAAGPRSGRAVVGGQAAPRLDGVVNRKPCACSCGMSRSSAATVWERSPPASCSSTTPPAPPTGASRSTMASTPGRCQSSLSVSDSTVT